MALHESLRELVAAQGPRVTEEAEQFRGALDDFLTEDEATTGELNLLVDAVRLGALQRLVTVLEQGAAPDAAIREAGAALARDRGTDDSTRSCWALAALGYALGKVDESVVRSYRSDTGTASVPTPPRATDPSVPAPPPSAAPEMYSLPGADQPSRSFEDEPQSQPAPPTAPTPLPPPYVPPGQPPYAGAGPPPYPGPVPPVSREERRGSTWLIVLLSVLVIAGIAVAGVWLLRSQDDDPGGTAAGKTQNPSANPTGSERRGDGTGEPGVGTTRIPENEILVPYEVGGMTRLYRVNTVTGDFEEVPASVQARLPAISPDRRTAVYLQSPMPFVPMVFDPESGDSVRLFADDGPCAYAGRPAWNASGDRIAVVCMDGDGDQVGIYTANVDDDLPLIPVEQLREPLLRDSPTWVSDTRLVYALRTGASETAPSALWTIDLTTGVTAQLTEGVFATHPNWSPDAQRLLYLVHTDDVEFGTLWTAGVDLTDAELTGATPLSTAEVAHPAWSPDGEEIAFAVDVDGVTKLATAPPDNLAGYRLVPNQPPGNAGVPAWGSR